MLRAVLLLRRVVPLFLSAILLLEQMVQADVSVTRALAPPRRDNETEVAEKLVSDMVLKHIAHPVSDQQLQERIAQDIHRWMATEATPMVAPDDVFVLDQACYLALRGKSGTRCLRYYLSEYPQAAADMQPLEVDAKDSPIPGKTFYSEIISSDAFHRVKVVTQVESAMEKVGDVFMDLLRSESRDDQEAAARMLSVLFFSFNVEDRRLGFGRWKERFLARERQGSAGDIKKIAQRLDGVFNLMADMYHPVPSPAPSVPDRWLLAWVSSLRGFLQGLNRYQLVPAARDLVLDRTLPTERRGFEMYFLQVENLLRDLRAVQSIQRQRRWLHVSVALTAILGLSIISFLPHTFLTVLLAMLVAGAILPQQLYLQYLQSRAMALESAWKTNYSIQVLQGLRSYILDAIREKLDPEFSMDRQGVSREVIEALKAEPRPLLLPSARHESPEFHAAIAKIAGLLPHASDKDLEKALQEFAAIQDGL